MEPLDFWHSFCYIDRMTKPKFRQLYAHLIEKFGEPEYQYRPRLYGRKNPRSILHRIRFPDLELSKGCFASCLISILDYIDTIYEEHSVVREPDGVYVDVVTEHDIERDLKTHAIKSQCFKRHGQLHRANGPAKINHFMGRKGKPIKICHYYWHGQSVTRKFVREPKKQTLKDIYELRGNITTMQMAIDRMGWNRYLELLDPAVIDRHEDDISNTKETLLCSNSEEMPDARFLLCACPSTARVFPIQVPTTIKTCQQAQTWLLGNRYRKVRLIGAS